MENNDYIATPSTEYNIAVFGFDDDSQVSKIIGSIPNVQVFKVVDSNTLGSLCEKGIFDTVLINENSELSRGIASLIKNADTILPISVKEEDFTKEEFETQNKGLLSSIYLSKQKKYKQQLSKALGKIEEKVIADENLSDDQKITTLLNLYLRLIKQKNPSTLLHSVNVSRYIDIFVDGLSEYQKPTEEQLIFLKRAALIHDIGKLSVLDEVLTKNGKLTDEEYEAIKDHVSGDSYLFKSDLMQQFKATALCHHLRYDGGKRSYPKEYSFLAGDEIPYFSRIISVIDAFEAMTGDRTYKQHRTLEEVIEILESEKGKQFDPEIVTQFVNGLKLHPEFEQSLNTLKPQSAKNM